MNDQEEELIEMEATTEEERRKQVEAKRAMRSFAALQTWVLSLADEDPSLATSSSVGGNGGVDGTLKSSGRRRTNHHLTLEALTDVIDRNRKEVEVGNKEKTTTKDDGDAASATTATATATTNQDVEMKDASSTKGDTDKEEEATTTKTSNKTISNDDKGISTRPSSKVSSSTPPPITTTAPPSDASFLPPSTKSELIAITFPLFVHTYLDLVESGLERTAESFLSTFRHVHEPYHTDTSSSSSSSSSVFRDLDRCQTRKKINNVLTALERNLNAVTSAEIIKKDIREYGRKIRNAAATESDVVQMGRLDRRYKDLVSKNAELHRELERFPFLRRIKSARSYLSIGASTFGVLARFLRSREEFLLPVSVMLQLRCKISVEKRDPLPFTPACVFEDMLGVDNDDDDDDDDDDGSNEKKNAQDEDVRWAAPVHPQVRATEDGETLSAVKGKETLPFPKFYLQKEYETQEDYKNDKNRVEFNRALLVNGFRRLEALEVKAEYEAGTRRPKRNGKVESGADAMVNPVKPSIMLATLCASSSNSSELGFGVGNSDLENSLEESGIDICCAKFCPPDGRRVAAGCNDSALRIWSIESMGSNSNKGSSDNDHWGLKPHESSITLLGHKNGLPIFDLDWNKDGRSLLSAGGDGTIRLWDTTAVGPIGKLAKVVRRTSTTHAGGNKSTRLSSIPISKRSTPNTNVPGARAESMVEKSGAALTCYRGHESSLPVWSVSMAPCGYYFASAGADRTARLWCTDRTTPVRIFAGHLSSNVNCISWHPNCNYVFSGSDDKTVRMWDVQTGRTVRLLTGCGYGVNHVQVSPSGNYAAGADYGGIVHIWDIRNGRKLNELRAHSKGPACSAGTASCIHSMSYSPCGTTLATGGDDCTVRIWDARGLGNHSGNPDFAGRERWGQGTNSLGLNDQYSKSTKIGAMEPLKTFRSIRTMVMDVKYTKRNLLLAVGKFSAAAPMGTARVGV